MYRSTIERLVFYFVDLTIKCCRQPEMRNRRPTTTTEPRTGWGARLGCAGPAGAYLERDKRENEYDGTKATPHRAPPAPLHH